MHMKHNRVRSASVLKQNWLHPPTNPTLQKKEKSTTLFFLEWQNKMIRDSIKIKGWLLECFCNVYGRLCNENFSLILPQFMGVMLVLDINNFH